MEFLDLCKEHHFLDLGSRDGDEGEEGDEEGPSHDKGEWRRGTSLYSTTKSHRKSLSKEELSNKLTSLCNINKIP